MYWQFAKPPNRVLRRERFVAFSMLLANTGLQAELASEMPTAKLQTPHAPRLSIGVLMRSVERRAKMSKSGDTHDMTE
jgi:hypothetical protein